MENENGNDIDGDKGEDEEGDNQHQPMRPVPPPEAFRQMGSFRSLSEQTGNEKDHLNGPINQNEATDSSVAAVNTTAAPQRPLIRRPSSLFGQLPVRRKSRLFDDIATSSSNVDHKNNGTGNSIVAETMMATNFSGSQSTWLQDDHQSTLLGGDSEFGDTRSQFRAEHQREGNQGKPSLFGAVMRQFGSSISSALPPSSPFRPSGAIVESPQKNATGGGGFRNLMASPSGKTIMNIVNQFNSPFKFQSPSSSHKKRQRRRRLWNDNEDSNDKADVSPKKRRRIDEEDENSKQSSNFLFPDTNDSRSSLGGGLVDEYWREAPIVDTDDGVRMEVLDWSLVTKVRIEAHGGTSQPTWILDTMRDREEAFTYWIHQSPIVTDEPQTLIEHGNNSSNLSSLQKSTGAVKSFMSRQGSFSSRLDAKLTGKLKGNNKKVDGTGTSTIANQLAKELIQSVRGPNAKFSRKRVLDEHCWWEERTTQREERGERSRRRWQQALRSVFSNYRRRLLTCNTRSDCLKQMVLDTYFYCIGQDHSVLFRLVPNSDANIDNNSNSCIDKIVPVVLISSTSDSFRKKLESNGMDITRGCENGENFQFLESIQEREARERKKIIAATAAAAKKSKRFFNNVTQDVRADLEALRRAQAFGESAGADVMVKVKKKGDGADEDDNKERHPKGLQISGWENVSLFLEVYLNLFGDTMGDEADTTTLPFHNPKTTRNKILPLLICPNTNGFGAFEHASLKKLSLFPVEKLHSASAKSDEKKHADEQSMDAMEIRGIVLPSAIRKILLVARNQILKDEKSLAASSISRKSQPKKDIPDSSRYIVLHSSRPAIINSYKELPKSWIGGMNGSLIFNQGKKTKTKRKGLDDKQTDGSNSSENEVFECSYGNVVSMAVWDTSREEVAACKLDSAFPENWIHRK